MNAPSAPTDPDSLLGDGQSFRDWAQEKSLSEALAHSEAAIRIKPQEPRARWFLFEMLCILGHWARALKQLQAWAELSKDFDSTAHLMRGLIRAECQREEVLTGRALPATVISAQSHASTWTAGLGEALTLARSCAQGMQASDSARETALAQAPDTPGSSNLISSFVWISDSDTRLGPVCEVVLMGGYRWLAFDDLHSLVKPAPARLLDLVWSQVDLVLRDGTALKGYIPVRYPVNTGSPVQRDALLMARETVWSEVGRTGVHARGQKMWMTDAGDLALLDLRQCYFNEGARAPEGDSDGGLGDAVV